MDDLSREEKRALWRCRRGTRELDEILGRFVSAQFRRLSDEERRQFDRLLRAQDPDLTDWLCNGVKPSDQGVVHIVQRILSATDSQDPA